MSGIGSLLEEALVQGGWNNKFSNWCKPPSDSEETRIQRAGSMIREAIRKSGNLPDNYIEIVPQGSYQNNTNVRLNSDMDLCVCYTENHLRYHIPAGSGLAAPDIGLSPLPAEIVNTTAINLKQILYQALRKIGDVEWGKKALKVKAVDGSRIDADAVPALRYWHVVPKPDGTRPFDIIEGIAIYADDGKWIVNFPKQHYERGVAKNNATGRRYKRTVRILKKIKEDMVAGGGVGALAAGNTPSFLIECLAFNCPDSLFPGDDWYETVTKVLPWIESWTLTDDGASYLYEVNGINPLFGADQAWTRVQALTFARAALAHISA